ncbi:hybrid sensor histidine kinase/response regulator [Pseudanabaena sp. FACHB-1998]|uniref:hybrid sensor histidine kinase/response regulator n=1 Tax=Pseudanabaena sp. FACHB-1998 TaxID=2692858 RepID=UPI0016817830|nr:hybrid sensor histidine kinase/response regulator [Pseudanabaena sp. FACHB-1998]MBD2178019.1 hybrid sensor histidine kinase/response regulator [Pseudanabaena sp. FACHB-1998]
MSSTVGATTSGVKAPPTFSDREWEVRLLFLDEVKDFLVDIETEVLGLSDRELQRSSINKILRAAHSMKGGAAMMSFNTLSDLAHRLEDFFKILQSKHQTEIPMELESLFLSAIDGMRKISTIHKQRQTPKEQWVTDEILPPFKRLREILGDLSVQDEANLLSEEAGEDMRVLMFATEVDACLERLTNVLADPNSQVLREEFEITSQEFGCLGEMLELKAFTSLCEGVTKALENHDNDLREVTYSALEVWRRSQALVLVGQFDALPKHFEILSPPKNSAIANKTLDKDPAKPNEKPFPFEIFSIEDLSLPSSVSSNAEEDTLILEPEELQVATDLSAPPATVETSSVETSSVETSKIAADSKLDSTIRIPVRHLEVLSDRFGELNAERSGLRLQLQRMRDLVMLLNTRMHGLEQSNAQLREAYDRVVTSSESLQSNIAVNAPLAVNNGNLPSETALSYDGRFDLLEMDRYSELHVLSREIMDSVVQLQEVSGDLETALSDTETTERELGRASRQMQTAIEQARMRMLSEILGRFPRLLRDLSINYGKQVELVVRGSSTLVERSVLEILEDPLLHLVRNAFDHGIETPEARIAAGKPPKGKIEIAAGYRGNQTVITISDDGNGVDFEKLRDRALQMGLSESDLAGSSETDLLELLFEAGFSTADRVTELSGRGVGMDVVRSNLNMIGGNVRIETEAGKGTSFILTVPVSLSIARVLLFESNGLQMAILTSAVEEILLIRDVAIYRVANQEVLDWEGYSVPLLRLEERLHFSRPQFQFETENRPVVDEPLILIVAKNNLPFALQVDRYWGEQEVTIRGVQSVIPMPTGFMGCAILGGGKIVPLVDIDNLIDWAIADVETPPSKNLTLTSEKGDRWTTVLVVDDSINVRRFLAMTLEKSGYRVEQAKDGHEAMEKLRKLQMLSRSSKVRAVICDIEMPRLDGFGFLVQSRSDALCKDIPVVMLTSRSGSKHRDLAMRLGASAYFAKPFKDNELLQTLSQLTFNSDPSN